MKLMTKKLRDTLPEYGTYAETENFEDIPIHVKFFTPDGAATWWLYEGEKFDNGDIRFFGFATMGDPTFAEFGTVMLSDLEAVRGHMGLPVERDMHYRGTVADAMREAGK